VQKRPICKSCSTHLTPWGRTSSGKKRYACRKCGKSRIYKNTLKKVDFFELFRQYILWGFTYKALSSLSGYSIPYLARKFHSFFASNPPELGFVDQSQMTVAYLLIDGLWFGRYFVLMVYRQSQNLTILHISSMKREVSSKIAVDLRYLTAAGYHFTGVVSDGGTGIVGAIERAFPHMPHQICLAHLLRDVSNAIGKYPKDDRIKALKILADLVWLINTHDELGEWIKLVREWETNNFRFLLETRKDADTGQRWFIHKGARKALGILKRLPDTSFTFLNHDQMPKTTNELEATLGHVGRRWINHTGLKEERWEDFLNWFVYFYNQEKLTASKPKKVTKNHTFV